MDDNVTIAGMLVFGTEDAIARRLPHYRIEYLEIPGISYDDGPTRYSYRISSEQNIFSTFFDINERLMKKIEIPFSVIGGIRDDDPPQAQAVREALVNLLIHSDYFSRMNPRIRVFSDRLEFFNPGPLPKSLDDILREDLSLPRNPTITKMFRYIRLAENIGSGFHKMIDGWKHHYGNEPLIEGDFDHYRITFHFSEVEHPGSSDRTAQKTAQKTILKTTPMQAAIIEYLDIHPYASRKQLAEDIQGITESGIKYNLKRLQDLGLIKHMGSAKGGHWEVIK